MAKKASKRKNGFKDLVFFVVLPAVVLLVMIMVALQATGYFDFAKPSNEKEVNMKVDITPTVVPSGTLKEVTP